MAKKSGLGKGLGLLVGEADAETAGMRPDSTLPIDQIKPNKGQPRKNFKAEDLAELTDSIKQNGILQPLLVRKKGALYEIVAGERRYQAARAAGLTEVPVVIRDISDDDVFKLALIENLQRSDLTPLEEARGYQQLIKEKGLTQEDAALIGAAAVFCDIGLLGVPDLAIEEGEEQDGPDAQLYYQHTKLGHDLFLRQGPQIPLLRYAAEIALWHHKNADGSGYPKEEDGTAIPISAQLTRTALRIQHYLRYYRGCTDNVERMLRTLKSEAGVTIAPELYQVAEQESRGIQSILQST